VAVQVAREDASKHARAWSPTVDVVAQLAQERIAGSGDFGSPSNSAGSGLIGLQLSVPLYTGGMREARHAETLRLLEKADAELERTRREVARHVRAAWLGLDAGLARVAALEQAVVASEARLASTRTGHQVGDRTTLDLLDAQNASATAALALTQARVAWLVDRLRLAALAGRLDEGLMREIDAAAAGR
jgi:outer membrane protein